MGLVFGALRVSLCTQPHVPSCHHGRRRCHSRSPAWPLPHCGGKKKLMERLRKTSCPSQKKGSTASTSLPADPTPCVWDLPPRPCAPNTLLFPRVSRDFLVPPRNQSKPGEFGALQEKEAKSLWPREQPRLYFIPLQRIIWNSTLQGRRCRMNSNQG